jgi:hypothetical protein
MPSAVVWCEKAESPASSLSKGELQWVTPEGQSFGEKVISHRLSAGFKSLCQLHKNSWK